MRLLQLDNGGGFSLVEFVGKYIPRYAVLSHTWGPDHDEVTFKDLMDRKGNSKPGYKKIHFCTSQAARDGLQFSWVDTCYIDKSSSAELSEAINSMFRWYHDAAKCYVYLPDVSTGSSIENLTLSQRAFQNSRWFTRGWTLQELIAPTSLEFFSVEGVRLGNKYSRVQEIHEITGINILALQGNPLSEFSIDERMSWAAKRETKREEDAAYSLLGIFDVHMPLIYGEGRKKALIRLRREVRAALKDEIDHGITQYQWLQKRREGNDAGFASITRPKAENTQDFSDLETGTRKLSQEREQQPGSAQNTASTSGINGMPTEDLHPQESVDKVHAEGTADDTLSKDDVGKHLRDPLNRPQILWGGSRAQQGRQIIELQDEIANLNRMIAELKKQANQTQKAYQASLSALSEKDKKTAPLEQQLAWLHQEVAQLVKKNEALTKENVDLTQQHTHRYAMLETQLALATRELAEARNAQTHLLSSLEYITRNEQYFKDAFQELCQRIQEWILLFSKSSDTTACRLTSDIINDKILDRLDNAVLDGSDVDIYLADRVKRRDILMSVTTTMVWEHIISRYLFRMDHPQRKQLKSLERTLSKIGPTAAVRVWRATTLTLMSKQEGFQRQRDMDITAIAHGMLETLSEILQPPSNVEMKIMKELAGVLEFAAGLSIEMRCQKAEYKMLPPTVPDYDVNGDLKSNFFFDAVLMNERSRETISNEALEAEKAIVRIMLFPLVVKKGDDSGDGDRETTVYPAQVLVVPHERLFSKPVT